MTQPSVPLDLIRAAQGGDNDAMWSVISAYEPTLRGVVQNVAPGAADVDDLMQEARVALMLHIRAYNTSADTDAGLGTFAFQAVRRAVMEEWIRASTATTVDPTTALRVRRALGAAKGDVEAAWGIVSSPEDPRRRMSREAFMGACEALVNVRSLDEPAHAGQDGGTVESLGSTIPDSTSDFANEAERRDLARFLLSRINARQAYALRATYGIGMMLITDDALSDELRLSSHARHAALKQLRQRGLNSARQVAQAYDLYAVA